MLVLFRHCKTKFLTSSKALWVDFSLIPASCSTSISRRHYNFTQNDIEEPKSVTRIISNVIYQDAHIIGINKPYGVSAFGNQDKQAVEDESEEERCSQDMSIHGLLPVLAKRLNIPNLDIGLSLKSFYSGLILLTKSPTSADNLKRAIAQATSQKQLAHTYLAITIGEPQCRLNQVHHVYLAREYLHNREMSVVCDQEIRSARKEGAMIQTSISIRVISTNKYTSSSLVEVKISKDKWDAIPVILSHYLNPVLGDNIYSTRTSYLMGVPIAMPPNAAIPSQQRLPINTEDALWDVFNLKASYLPLFIHRSKISLSKFPYRSSKQYEVEAVPSDSFVLALNSLGLKLENHYS